MKEEFIISGLFILLLIVAGCSGIEPLEKPPEKIPTDVTEPEDKRESFRGEIIEVQDGKDGSTITLKDQQGKTIKTTVSIPNLGSDLLFDFSALEVGNTIHVTGKAFMLGEEKHLTADYALVIHDKNAKAPCEENGGNYERFGMMGIYVCNMPTIDAGESCNDSDDCQSFCLSKEGKGACADWTHNDGCIAVIENGQEHTLCID